MQASLRRAYVGYAKPLAFSQEGRTVAIFLLGVAILLLNVKAIHRATGGSSASAATVFGIGLYMIVKKTKQFANGQGLDLRLCKPRVVGKTFVITGGSRGLGKELASLLYQLEAGHVILCMRDSKKRIRALVNEIECLSPYKSTTRIDGVDLDLSKPETLATSVNELRFLLKQKPIDCLVCNAGITSHESSEMIMTVNWKSHVLLIEAFKSELKKIVLLTSCAQALGSVPPPAAPRFPLSLYGCAKLAMLLEARYIAHAVPAVAVHPGWVNTDIVNHTLLWSIMTHIFAKERRYGALTVLSAVAGDWGNGEYIDSTRVAPVYAPALDPLVAKRYVAMREAATRDLALRTREPAARRVFEKG